MRHIGIFALLSALLLTLSGCGPHGVSPADDDFQDAWDEAWDQIRTAWTDGRDSGGHTEEKRHCYQILDGDGALLYTISDEAAVDAVDSVLSAVETGLETPLEHGEEGGEAAYIYCYCQEKTLLAGEDPDEERDYEELVRFTVCRDRDLVTLKILGGTEELNLLSGAGLEDLLTFTFPVSAETAEALRDPARFAEAE